MVARIKISKATVDRLTADTQKRAVVWDNTLQGFGVRVGKHKVYFVQKKVDGVPVRVTLGKHGQITPDQARKMAQETLGKMSAGKNPNQEKRLARVKSLNLKTAFADFLETRKSLKPRTIKDYTRFMQTYFKEWQYKPLAAISRQMVEKKHKYIGDGHGGQAQANGAMRFLRALFHFAMARYNDDPLKPVIPENPVKTLSQTRSWYKIARKQSVVKTHQLPALFEALDTLEKTSTNSEPETIRDYLIFCLFTGLRRNEAAQLTWENIDFEERTFIVTDTKNWKPLKLPLSGYLFDLLKRRHETRGNEYVFPGRGKHGYLIEPKRQMQKIKKLSGVEFSLHDLRRTFITIAESLDVPHYALKQLVNHSLPASDVTSGYIVTSAERLRAPMERITDAILRYAGKQDKAKVIPLKAGGKGSE